MSVVRNQASSEDSINVKTILVVEDDEDIGSFIVEALLQETSHQALLVTNGSKALETVKTIKPNLFVLDYLLPRMNGIDLYDQLHATKELEHIPAIMMSAKRSPLNSTNSCKPLKSSSRKYLNSRQNRGWRVFS